MKQGIRKLDFRKGSLQNRKKTEWTDGKSKGNAFYSLVKST